MPLADPTSTRWRGSGGGGVAQRVAGCRHCALCPAALLLQLHFVHSMTKMDDGRHTKTNKTPMN